MRHTFWSCLIRCANMKWIWWVLLKIQSGHDSVHRRTDGQGDTSIPPFQLRWSGGTIMIFDLSVVLNLLSQTNHNSEVIWALWHSRTPAPWLFVHQLIQANNKRNMEGLHHWPSVKVIHWSAEDFTHNGLLMWSLKAFFAASLCRQL